MSVELSFWLFGMLICGVAAYGVWRFRTPLNPLTLYCMAGVGTTTFLSGLVAALSPLPLKYGPEAIVETTLISMLHLGGVTAAYLMGGDGPARLFGRLLGLFGLNSPSLGSRYSPWKMGALLAAALLTLSAMAAVGGGGLLWITNSREAYASHKILPLWCLCEWLIAFAQLYYLWTRRPHGWRLAGVTAAFIGLMFLLGSKGNVITVFMVSLVYQHFLVRRIPLAIFVALTPLVIVAGLGLIVIQGTSTVHGASTSLFLALYYLQDYFDTTAQFLSRFGEFGLQYGRGWLSYLWFFVPRALYPDKPIEFGPTLLHRVLFPGAAAAGYTPGYLSWSLSYLDFGAVGVFFDGLAVGLWQRMAYEHFLRRRNSFFAFVGMIQLSLWSVFVFAPFVFTLPLLLAMSVFLRLRIRWAGGSAAVAAQP